MNRYDNYLLDMDGDSRREIVSAINGTWNRISVYSEDGKPLHNVQIGPGSKEPRSNITMMHTGDMDDDGKAEIIFGLASGLVNALDAKAEKLWSVLLPSPAVVIRTVPGSDSEGWICAGCADGTILAMNARGEVIRKAMMEGKPADIQILKTTSGPVVIITTVNGDINGFRLDLKTGNSKTIIN
jgi:hypothetical protein